LDLHGERKMSHFLSFIITGYNCADTIEEAIDSIYHQNLNIPFEVIVTNDCSTDTTKDILLRYERQNSNFYSYHHNINQGTGAGRNTCVRHSKGDLIFVLDADNFLESNTINQLVSHLDKNNCEGASFLEARIFVTFEGKHSIQGHIVASELSAGNICDLACFLRTTKNPVSHGNYLYTRKSFDLVGGYPEGQEGTPEGALEAYKFGFRQLAMDMKIAVLLDSFYWHRLSSGGKWMRDDELGVNSKAQVEELRKFAHLFTAETNKLLASEELTRGRTFSKKLNKGCFKLK
jgi:glycosyltransferase involved in cell wall biosynthesis